MQNLNALFGVAYGERRWFSVPQLGYLGYQISDGKRKAHLGGVAAAYQIQLLILLTKLGRRNTSSIIAQCREIQVDNFLEPRFWPVTGTFPSARHSRTKQFSRWLLLQGFLGFPPLFLLGCYEFVRDVILVDIRHVVDRFGADSSSGYDLDIANPNIRVEPLLGFLTRASSHNNIEKV